MIAKIGIEDFPITAAQAVDGMQLVAKRIRENYRSRITLVTILPRARWFGEVLEREIKALGGDVLGCSCGVALRISREPGVRPQMVVVEPPSVHAVKDRKVVIVDSVGEWATVSAVASFLVGMKPQTVEVASYLSFGALPKWVNPEYVLFETSPDFVVRGLGVGATTEEQEMQHFVAEIVKTEVVSAEKQADSAENVVENAENVGKNEAILPENEVVAG